MYTTTKRCAWAFAALALATQAHAATYSVYLEGTEVDLLGTIEFSQTGVFTSDQFEANVGTFAFTASLNGLAAFEFTDANSTFGGSPFGTDVTFSVTESAITLTAPTGGPGLSNNAFVVADDTINGSRPNLLLFDDQLRYRTPSPPNVSIFETVNPEFVLARIAPPAAIPLPASIALYLPILGLGALLARRRRRARS